ncbi:MAG: response regulator, partial [Candidatus Omnitrophica bacterium]|nr:response regulator [Candidatus Omnitrophota bacterium]
LLFSVIDNGIGIPKDRLNSVFEAFTQAEESTTRKFGGTGLGLAISKRLVEMMGGRIWADSEEGNGSTFSFTATFKMVKNPDGSIPLDGEFIGKEMIAEDQGAEKLKGLKILLAEDNVVNQKIAVKILEKQGFVVAAANNGLEVLDMMKKEKYDVILMDAFMPELDGMETTKQIRSEEEGTGKHIPIIALTARAMQEDRQKCIDVGMDGYVSKPIDRKKLFQEIASIINKG